MKPTRFFPGLILISVLCLIVSCPGWSKTRVAASLSNRFPEITASGQDHLVSALWRRGAAEQSLYLPQGETWIYAWGKEYAGRYYVTVNVPPYKIPVFIRKGASVDSGNLKELYASSLNAASDKPDLSGLEKEEGWKL